MRTQLDRSPTLLKKRDAALHTFAHWKNEQRTGYPKNERWTSLIDWWREGSDCKRWKRL